MIAPTIEPATGNSERPSTPQALKIACIGECMVELRANGENQFASGFAGDALNTAIYLARSQLHSVSFVSAVGCDAISQRMIESWQNEGIDTSLVGRHDSRLPGLYMIENDSSGERTFHYWRSASAARTLFLPESKLSPAALKDVDAIYASGISLAIMQPEARADLISFLQTFRADGGIVAYDSNYRPVLWESVQTAQEVNTRMWSVATHGFPSIDDELALFGETDESAVVERLLTFRMPELLLKRGDLGPRIFSAGDELESAALPSAGEVVDTTGAGDSFNAGYLAQRLSGVSMIQSARDAHLLALQVIAHPGAILPRESRG